MECECLSPERLSISKELRAFGVWCHEVRETVDELASRLPSLDLDGLDLPDREQGCFDDHTGEFDIAHLQGIETAYRLRLIADHIEGATPKGAQGKKE
jgi:hypothetical protein